MEALKGIGLFVGIVLAIGGIPLLIILVKDKHNR